LLRAAFLASSRHRRALSADQMVAPGKLPSQQLHLGLQARSFERFLDHHGEVIRVERLGNEIVGAALDRLDGALDGAVGRDDDDRKRGIFLLDFAQRFDAVHAGHLIV
jgi:hypothetical protein